ncbi:short-chain dehydrogenase/reductase family 16C member 6-like [Diaphorina citri]|uniref:Short-chain dehydrogenase/reductase family 16C member 6-like n=1 Tax=Diaphorina citri TaxID=121845 RepID=A0A3Q0JJ90_DIACI|nr:short-chain dehydrogenase/reductase family 16C member 6-like [Diaphorina citri]
MFVFFRQITGAGRGLGKELAEQLAQEGCELILTDINEEGVKQTAEEINSRFEDKVAVYFKANSETLYRYLEVLISSAFFTPYWRVP